MEGTVATHKSYGNITVTRCSSTGTFLFGSDARHHHFVHVEINSAEMRRDLSHNWLSPRKRLVEFYMTESQWAHFVSSFSDGTGTPVTLRYFNGEDMGACPPPEQQKSQFATEVKERVAKAIVGLKTIRDRIKASLMPNAKPLNKTELKKALSEVDSAVLQVEQNLPWIEKVFNESMEKKTTEAKIEFEAIVARRLQQMGLESLRASLPESTDSDPFHDEGNATNRRLSQCGENCTEK